VVIPLRRGINCGKLLPQLPQSAALELRHCGKQVQHDKSRAGRMPAIQTSNKKPPESGSRSGGYQILTVFT
jgi:hypothetical protein